MAAQDIEYVELYPSDHVSVLDYLVSSLTFIPVLMRQNLQRLLDNGYSARVVRDDIDAQELLIMVSAVTGTVGAGPRQSRFVDVILSGLTPK